MSNVTGNVDSVVAKTAASFKGGAMIVPLPLAGGVKTRKMIAAIKKIAKRPVSVKRVHKRKMPVLTSSQLRRPELSSLYTYGGQKDDEINKKPFTKEEAQKMKEEAASKTKSMKPDDYVVKESDQIPRVNEPIFYPTNAANSTDVEPASFGTGGRKSRRNKKSIKKSRKNRKH